MTASVLEEIGPSGIGASSVSTFTTTASLVASDVIVVILSVGASATPSVTAPGLTFTEETSAANNVSSFRHRVFWATGATGITTVSINPGAVSGRYQVYVLRGLTSPRLGAKGGSTYGATASTSKSASAATVAADQVAILTALAEPAVTITFPTSVTPSSWSVESNPASGAGGRIYAASKVIASAGTAGGSILAAGGGAPMGITVFVFGSPPPNVAPTVTVPADFSTPEDSSVSIHATAADSDGTIASYAWTVTASSTTPPTLTGASTADVGFTPGVPMTLTLRCTVTDNGGATAFDEITVTVTEVPPAEGLTAELEDGTPIETLISSRLTMSDSWTPYIRATLVVKRTAALDVLNPNVSEPPRIIVTLSQPGFTRTFDLSLQRRVNRSDSTATLELTSDEVRLHEYKRVATDIYIPPTGSLRELVAETLAEVGYEIDPSGPNAAVIPDGTAWNPGQTAWSFINPAIQAAGMRLWCDEFRVFHMNTSPQARSGSIVVDYDGPNLIDYRDDADRDSWFDAVVLTFKWTDVLGDDYVAYDIASVPGFSHPYDEVRVDTPYPGPGAAESLLARFLTRGHTAPFTAISDYRATPGMSVILSTPENGIQGGWITGVTWAGDGTMQIDPRSIEEITEYAWLFDTPGVSWLDVAVGVDWSEDV